MPTSFLFRRGNYNPYLSYMNICVYIYIYIAKLVVQFLISTNVAVVIHDYIKLQFMVHVLITLKVEVAIHISSMNSSGGNAQPSLIEVELQ